MTFSIMDLNMTLSIMTLCISIKCHYAESSIFYCYAECHYAECRRAQCRGASIKFLWDRLLLPAEMVDSNPWSWDVVVVVVVAVIVVILVEMVNVSAFIIAEVDDIILIFVQTWTHKYKHYGCCYRTKFGIMTHSKRRRKRGKICMEGYFQCITDIHVNFVEWNMFKKEGEKEGNHGYF